MCANGSVKMKVTLEFKDSHHYIENYSQSDINYCPGCGSIGTVWSEDGRGDYYCGPDHVCTHCNCSFTIQGPSQAQGPYLLVIEQIKTGKQLTPTTKAGS